MKGKASKIGVVTATISAMTVDLVGPGGTFGRLDVPAIKMGSFGANVTILDQVVSIVDMDALKAFVRAIMQNESLVLRLENGHATVKAMGVKSSIIYRKEIHLKGLKALKAVLIHTEQDGGIYKSIFSMDNPSHFEVNLGRVSYEVKDENGRQIAEQMGATHIKRGEFNLTVTGPVTSTVSKGEAKFVGFDVNDDNWLKEIIDTINIMVVIPSKFKSWHT
jgi:hypothetical protein